LFDELYPVATIVLIALILCLPLIVLILFRMAKRRRKYGPATPQQSLDSNRRIQKWLGGVGIAALLVAGGLVLYALSVGSFTEKPTTRIMHDAGTSPSDGYMEGKGLVLTDRLAFYRQGLPLSGRRMLVAPVVADLEQREIQYFLKVPEQDPTPAKTMEIKGYLKAEAVPGGLEILYENAGYSLKRPTYIVFEDHKSARSIWFGHAESAAIAALLLFLAYLLLGWFNRRQRKKIEDAVNSNT